MSDRQTKVILTAQVAGYITGMEQAAKKTRDASKAAEEASGVYEKQHQAMTTAGTGLVAVGAAAVAATALAVKAAMDWESAWAGVTKTVDGTPEQMGELEASLRSLAKELPSTHEEIAAVAEAAGQLGVQRESITDFTRVMINLGETTNLSADEAATSIAQLMNVMGTAPDEVENLGSALVALGNDGASTERDIVQMAQRMAGAAKLVGASEADVLALANAMASVGISAELGGGAMSRILQDIYAALAEGGEKAQSFANVTGLSAQEFAKAFREDPVAAVDAFIGGLNNVEASGGNVIGVLSDLGIKSTEEVSTLLRLKGAGDLLADSLDLGAKAWEENNALQEEAAKRYETTAAQLEIARNNVYDTAITFGDVFLPAIAGAAGAVADIAAGIGALPAPVLQAVAVVVALAGAATLSGGAFLLAVPKIAEYSLALKTLSASNIPAVAAAATGMQKATTASAAGLSKMSAFLTGPYGLALAAAAIGVKLLTDYVESLKASTEDYQNAIATGADTSKLFELTDQGRFISYLGDATASAEAFQGRLNTLSTSDFATGLNLSTQQLKKSLQDLGDELATTASSDLPAAQAAFSQIASDMELSDDQMLQLLNSMPAYKDALKQQATQLGQTASDQNLLKLAQQETLTPTEAASDAYMEQAEAAQGLADELTGLIDAINEVNGVNQDAISANADFQESLAGISEDVQRQKDDFIALQKEGYEAAHGSLDGYTESLDGFSLSLDGNTASGATNAASLSGVAASAQEAAAAQFEVDKTTMSAKDAADKYATTLSDQRQKFVDAALAAGYSAGEVQALANKVFALPSSKEIDILAETAAAQSKIDSLITLNSGRVVRISVQATNTTPGSWTGGLTQADGGVVDYYADGGLRENHVAQIAPAGSWRVWAEDETGGEAYIPLHPSKRDRSLAIWAETGRRLEAFADGGMWSSPQYVSPSFQSPTIQVAAPEGPSRLEGNLYLDSGELLGVVRGQIRTDRDQRGVTIANRRQRGK